MYLSVNWSERKIIFRSMHNLLGHFTAIINKVIHTKIFSHISVNFHTNASNVEIRRFSPEGITATPEGHCEVPGGGVLLDH